MNWFEYDGIRSDSMKLYIAEKRIYASAQRDIEMVYVPGRNGDVLIDHGGYLNVPVSYTVQFLGINEKVPKLRKWLKGTGYKLLRDSYDPDYVRYGVYTSVMDPDEIARNAGSLRIEFSCKPYRYRYDTLNTITEITESGVVVNNPEGYSSLPYIRIIGNGDVSLHIGNKSYPINGISGYIELDSELMWAYKLDALCNDKIGFSEFPELKPGENLIQWTGDVSKIIVRPRWRTI